MVLSVWGSREYWDTWVNDSMRQKINERINRMLRKPSSVRMFEDMAAPLPLNQTLQRGAAPDLKLRQGDDRSDF